MDMPAVLQETELLSYAAQQNGAQSVRRLLIEHGRHSAAETSVAQDIPGAFLNPV